MFFHRRLVTRPPLTNSFRIHKAEKIRFGMNQKCNHEFLESALFIVIGAHI